MNSVDGLHPEETDYTEVPDDETPSDTHFVDVYTSNDDPKHISMVSLPSSYYYQQDY